jgi:N-acetylmuramoyl-L-alanine amidase
VPSVLVELGFLSSPADEQNLRDGTHRERLAGAMLRALDRYFFPHEPS